MELENSGDESYVYWSSFLSGGIAGLVVDVALFPIDTIKTRLQSERGFIRSGGFHGIYKGLAPAAAGSVPTAAIFFCAYDGLKSHLGKLTTKNNQPYVYMVSAALAEIVACLIRVPVEIAKQRRQALSSKHSKSAIEILYYALKTEGIQRGLYRGYGSTVMREVPFSFIQFPLWEYFKQNWTATTGIALTPLTVAVCGAMAGGIAAGLTTPMDVVKTRVMLADENVAGKISVYKIIGGIYNEKGIKGLFAGFVPRVLWITLGGAVFFGFYDLTARWLHSDHSK